MDRFLIDCSNASAKMVAPVRQNFDPSVFEPARPELVELENPEPAEVRELLGAHVRDIFEKCAFDRLPAAPRLVAVGGTSDDAVSIVSRDTLEMRIQRCDISEAGLRRATTQEAPRGRVLVLALGDTFSELHCSEARKFLRAVRKSLLRGDFFLVSSRSAAEADTAVAMCAAAGFRLNAQWTDDAGNVALILVQAD